MKDLFDKYYDEAEKLDPEARQYRVFLTAVASHESGFDPKAKNAHAPAYGLFQFMQDGKKYNNISAYAGCTIGEFLNSPVKQILAAVKLAKAFERTFTQKDKDAAKAKGISRFGMIGGAWLGGTGGLRKYLHENKNLSDSYWSPAGAGVTMEQQIARYNDV